LKFLPRKRCVRKPCSINIDDSLLNAGWQRQRIEQNVGHTQPTRQ
jgi:hypothetical protein